MFCVCFVDILYICIWVPSTGMMRQLHFARKYAWTSGGFGRDGRRWKVKAGGKFPGEMNFYIGANIYIALLFLFWLGEWILFDMGFHAMLTDAYFHLFLGKDNYTTDWRRSLNRKNEKKSQFFKISNEGFPPT